ncbi:MAG: leucine-rich repeat domain-containing protein [Treponema sp.]|jgi:hypothetical protein|nr:leucine-rich repeat domain-containing protein [Treponema sp.]
MKKNGLVLGAVLAVCAALVLAGCGKKGGSDAGGGSGGGGSSDAKAAAALLQTLAGGDAAAMETALAALSPAVLAELTGSSGSPGGDFSYDLNKAGDGIVIRRYSGSGGVVVIPAAIEDYPVVEIGEDAFHGSFGSARGWYGQGDNISSVVVPASVQKIGKSAFEGCKNLTTVILPDTLEEIGVLAFYLCSALHTVNIPAGIKRIDGTAFAACGELYNLSIPGSLTAIGWGEWSDEFANCGKLKLATRQRLKDLGYTGEF